MRFPPSGFLEIVETFGDPRPFIDNQALWEETMLRSLPVPEGLFIFCGKAVKSIRVHNLAAPSFGKAVMNLANGGLWNIEYGGTYAYRVNRNNPGKISLHTWGVAIDLNPTMCPNGSHISTQDPRIVAAFRDASFTWVENDAMHAQLASGY